MFNLHITFLALGDLVKKTQNFEISEFITGEKENFIEIRTSSFNEQSQQIFIQGLMMCLILYFRILMPDNS